MVEREAERKIHIRLTQDMHRRLRIRCAETDVTIQDYVVRMLDQALDVKADVDCKTQSQTKERAR